MTAQPVDWNGTIAANNGSVSFGFTVAATSPGPPTAFAVNGTACAA
ncbi:cellulose binding domain-containing protein [Streptomyces litchfieldiae]|uniref:Cellulose binding domain-containing protein n=1 Tax=Streptomyces litchfieldiae TaxID=3075543 RepID=A0ABU2MJG0_9ACTN|nr:cellulose binding domain-containing protein [Streptomyces sp. DSM 44938]MDT0341741.1 cellulose binding domain-containing protein [Streptomyces sp. DSM 44938]